MRRLVTLATFGALLLAGVAYVAPRLRLDSELASLLPPAGADGTPMRAARAFIKGPSSRIVVVEVRGADAPAAWAAIGRIDAVLARSRVVASVGSRDVPTELARLSDVVDAHQDALGGTASELTIAELDAATTRLRELLSTPFAADHRNAIPRDPLLSRLRAWERVQSSLPSRRDRVVEGRLVTEDGLGVIETFVLTSRASTDEVLALVDEVETAAGAQRIRWSGVAPITARATQSIRGDVERVSTLSTIGVFLLLGIAFGRLRYIAIAALPLAAATISGLAAGIAIYGRVHGIALAFAGAMIGVVVDYVEHFLAHRMMSPVGTEASTVLDAIRPSLRLAALTTLVGVSGFAFSGYPGFREITVISGVGVLAGLLTTTLVVARIVGPHEGATTLQRAAARASKRIVAVLRARRGAFVVAGLVTLLGSALALSRATSVDDPTSLSGVPEGLLRDDAAVRAELGSADSVLLASHGASCQAATEAAERDLGALRSRLPGATVHSIVDLIPSQATQLRRIARTRTIPESTYRAALERADFDPDAFAPFYASLASESAPTISVDDLVRSAPVLFGARVVRDESTCWLSSFVDGADAATIRSALGNVDSTVVVDSHELHVGTYRRLRDRVLGATAAGLLAVFLICFARYRDLRRTVVACAPAILSALAAVSIASCFAPLDLLHGLGALLVVSMGTDYGIFFVDSADEGDAVDATFASVVVSALTTILSFGMLGLSHHRALASLGLTTALGVTLAVVLAPAALALVHKESE